MNGMAEPREPLPPLPGHLRYEVWRSPLADAWTESFWSHRDVAPLKRLYGHFPAMTVRVKYAEENRTIFPGMLELTLRSCKEGVSVYATSQPLEFSERRLQGGEIELGTERERVQGGGVFQPLQLDVSAHGREEVVRLG